MSGNDFANAIKKALPAKSESLRMDRGSKHIGGYFDPEVSKALKQIALNEDTTIQALLGEAIEMLLESRDAQPVT